MWKWTKRTLALVLCLATASFAGQRSRQVRYNREMGPEMQWYFHGPRSPVTGETLHRPTYDARSGLYYNHDGSVAAYPVRVTPRRKAYAYPGR